MLDPLRPARANCEGPAIFIGPFWREALRQSASDLFLAPCLLVLGTQLRPQVEAARRFFRDFLLKGLLLCADLDCPTPVGLERLLPVLRRMTNHCCYLTRGRHHLRVSTRLLPNICGSSL